MNPTLKSLFKFFVFLISLILLLLLSLIIYLSNPVLLNSTLPYLFDTDEICYDHRAHAPDNLQQERACQRLSLRPVDKGDVVYIQALSPAEFAQRYGLPVQSLETTYQQLSESGYALLNHWHARHDVLANDDLATVLPDFSQPLMGFQLMFVPAFPDECLGLFVNQHAWLNHYLVLEFAACDE